MVSGSRTKNRTSKAEQARATRQRIVESATELFLRDGFVTTTMAAIAAEAGVAVQTLYLSFGNKTAILSAAFDIAIAGDDEPVPVLERDWVRSVLADTNGATALTEFVKNATEVVGRATPLYGVIRAAAADPEVGTLLANNKRERHEGFAMFAASLSTKDGFSPQLTAADATGILYAVQSEETHALLVQEHDWTHQEWASWVLETVLSQLFPAATRTDRLTAGRYAGRSASAAAAPQDRGVRGRRRPGGAQELPGVEAGAE